MKKTNFRNTFLCRNNLAMHRLLGGQYYCCPFKKDSPGIIFAMNVASKTVVDATQGFLSLLKFRIEDLGNFSIYDIVAADVEEINGNIDKILNQGLMEMNLRQYRRKDGQLLYVTTSFRVARFDGHKYLIVTLEDVTELQQMRNRLQMAHQVFEYTSDGILVTDAQGIIQYANPAFVRNTGYSKEEIIGKKAKILNSGRQDGIFFREIWDSLAKAGLWRGEIVNQRKNGECYSEWVVIDAVKNELGKITMYCGIFRDLSERKKYEEKIRFYAYHDHLTGLPNRMLFFEKINQCLAAAKRYHHVMAVLYIDLDGFKHINDTLGHDKGDLLLKAVAACLQECVRESDIAARLGGDEFTLILPEVADRKAVDVVVARIKDRLNQPFELAGSMAHISGSIGISFYPYDGEDAETLVKKADHAMYEAKVAGRDRCPL